LTEEEGFAMPVFHDEEEQPRDVTSTWVRATLGAIRSKSKPKSSRRQIFDGCEQGSRAYTKTMVSGGELEPWADQRALPPLHARVRPDCGSAGFKAEAESGRQMLPRIAAKDRGGAAWLERSLSVPLVIPAEVLTLPIEAVPLQARSGSR
jgi:hypothetical protein